jgi:L-cysteine desulfidase
MLHEATTSALRVHLGVSRLSILSNFAAVGDAAVVTFLISGYPKINQIVS